MIGDDGQCLHGRARQFALLDGRAFHQERQVGRRAEHPFVGDTDQIDAALLVECLQVFDHRAHVGARRQSGGQRVDVERFGGGKQKRLGHADKFGMVGRVGGERHDCRGFTIPVFGARFVRVVVTLFGVIT